MDKTYLFHIEYILLNTNHKLLEIDIYYLRIKITANNRKDIACEHDL